MGKNFKNGANPFLLSRGKVRCAILLETSLHQNSIVKTWLINLMEAKIGQTYLLLQTFFLKQFMVKDLGHLKYFLGMETASSNNSILISQRNIPLI